MPTINGTDGNDDLVGTTGDDTFYPLLGGDKVDGLGGSDTLIIDYSHAPYDPYGGASVPGPLISTVSSNGGSFSGAINGGGAGINFVSIEHLQIILNFWQDKFVIDAAALRFGATISVNGGQGFDTLQIDLSSLSSVTTQADATGLTGDFGTYLNFEAFAMNLTEGVDIVTTSTGADTLTGNGGDDVLNSGGGNDILSGGAGSNILNGGEGDDQFFSIGIDTVDGGTGGDHWSGNYSSLTADISMTRNQLVGTATLSIGTTLAGIERIDSLVTGSGNDSFVFTGQGEGALIDAGAGRDSLTLTGNGFSSEVKADGAGAFQGFLGYDRFLSIEVLNFTSLDFGDVISVDAAPLLSGASLTLNAAGGSDTLILDLTVFASISFVVAANGTLTTNVPATLLNFENYQLSTSGNADIVTTGAGNDIVHGNGGNDVISTGGGNDLLDGGAGADSMTGGTGDDIYIVADAGDTIVENAGEGYDEVRASISSFSIAALTGIEDLTGTSDTGQTLTGNALANRITGGAGNDFLSGMGGADLLQGRDGNDTYFVDDAAASINESLGYGNDIVYTTVSYALTITNYSEVETLAVRDAATTNAINLGGNTYNQSIYGNAGANVLTGGGGTDIMYGLGGNDTYFVDSADDKVVELAGGGNDTIRLLTNYALAAGSEVETLMTDDPSLFYSLTLTGNEFGQSITGDAGYNVLKGLGGADILIGLGRNDILDGGTGADRMEGGTEDDIYYVDNAGDVIVEAADEGYDTVYTSVSYGLAANAAAEVLSATSWGGLDPLALTGNAFANTLYGNAGDNVLDGGAGVDVLNGQGGHDVYFLDNVGDRVVEGANGGFDTVFTSLSYTLGAGVWAEILSVVDWSATTPIALTGNELANRLYGNAGANVLTGAAGDDWLTGFGGGDTLVGGQGADTYWIWAGNDGITETAGNGYDTVYAFTSYVLGADANVEVVSTYSWIQGEAIDLTGNALSNVLFGNVGANVLNGGLGSDRMTGFAGADTFAFTTALGADNVDTVVDFVAGTDKIAMDDAIFTQAGGLGALSANAFVTGSAAGDADDRIIYNSATGALLYDADGSGAGAAVQFATLSTGLSLSASDFMVI